MNSCLSKCAFICRRPTNGYFCVLINRHRNAFTKTENTERNEESRADLKAIRNVFGTLNQKSGERAVSAPLKSESLPDDEDGYDVLEIRRTGKNRHYYKYALTEMIHRSPMRLQEAFRLFDEMRKVDRKVPESFHYTILISGCAEVGYTEKAFQLFMQMMKEGLNPTKATITSLFNACAQCANSEFGLEKAKFLRDWIFESSYICNVKQYNAMIKAFAKLGDMKTAFEILNEMVDNGHATSAETFNMLLMGCVSNKESGLLQAIKIIRKMIEHNCGLNHYTYNLLLRAVRDCEVGSAQSLGNFLTEWSRKSTTKYFDLQENSDHSLEKLPFKVEIENQLMNATHPQIPKTPNLLNSSISFIGQVVSFNMEALKKPCSRLQLIGGPKGVLDHMKANGITPTIKTFSMLLDSIPNTLEAEEELMKHMKESNVEADTDFYNMVIKRRSMRNDLKSSLDALTMMQSRSLLPNIMTFGVLAMGCAKKRQGLQLIKDMDKAGLTVNIEIVGALMSNACFRKDFDYIICLMKVIEEKKIAVNSIVVEKIMTTQSKTRQILLRHEQGKQEAPKRFLTEEYTNAFRQFNLSFKRWLKTLQFEKSEDVLKQYEYEFRHGKQQIYEFEKDMKKRITNVRDEHQL